MENKDYVQQSLADIDIDSNVKDGKVVVHKDNTQKAKSHLKKIGYGHVQVVAESKLSFLDFLKEAKDDSRYKIFDTHIEDIKPGDTVIHNGVMATVGEKDIKHGGFNKCTLFGDSYALGTEPVKKVVFPKFSLEKKT